MQLAEPGLSSLGLSAGDAVSEPEHRFLTAWRDLHTAVWENADSADVAQLASLVDEAARRMSSLKPFAAPAPTLDPPLRGFTKLGKPKEL